MDDLTVFWLALVFCVLDADPDLAAANCSWDPAHEDPDTTEQVPEEAEVPETVENPERSGSFLLSFLFFPGSPCSV